MKTIYFRFILSAIIMHILIIAAYAQSFNESKNHPPYWQDTLIDRPIPVEDIKGTTFDPDGKAVYFVDYSRKNLRPILVSHYSNGKWNLPDTIESTKKFICSDPFLSPDGSKLYFSNFTTPPPTIYVIERVNEKWSEPHILNDLINPPDTIDGQVYPTLTDNGTLYYTRGFGDIYCSKLVNGQYSEPERLSNAINTPEYTEWDACIARDESSIIFCSKRSKSEGSSDLYMSSKENGKWTVAVNLGININSSLWEGLPGITPDGKYLFFMSNKSGSRKVYQVDIKPLMNSLKYDSTKIE